LRSAKCRTAQNRKIWIAGCGNRILLYLLLAGALAYVLVGLSGRNRCRKISAVTPMRENLVSSISSNGKVEPYFAVCDASATRYVLWKGCVRRRDRRSREGE